MNKLNRIFLPIILYFILASWTTSGTRITKPSGKPLHCGVGVPPIANDTKLRIIGGQDASPGEFPFQVILDIPKRSGEKIRCGGSIIDDRHILTAASCLVECGTDTSKILDIFVGIGEHSFGTKGDGEIIDGIRGCIVHENFQPCSRFPYVDDIAIVKTLHKMTFKLKNNGYGSVNKVCLPAAQDDNIYSGEDSVTIAGWGQTSSSYMEQDILQVADIKIKDFNECQRAWSEQFNWQLDENKHICAYDREGIRSSCQADAGGPLLRASDDGDFYTAIGITSFGTADCMSANYPTVYTRISSYLDWIKGSKEQLARVMPD